MPISGDKETYPDEPLCTYVLFLTLDPDKVSGASVPPPQLSRDTPILDVLQPPVPLCLGNFGRYCQIPSSGPLIHCQIMLIKVNIVTYLECLIRQRFTVYPPLWLEYWFNDISRFTGCREGEPCLPLKQRRLPADGNLHRVVLGIDEKTGLLKSRYNGNPGMKPFRTLQGRQSLSA